MAGHIVIFVIGSRRFKVMPQVSVRPPEERVLMGKLDGRVALITGGARGMGAAEARLFAEEGAQVAIADILDADGIALAKSLGDAAEYLHLDVSSEQGWEQTVERTVARYGAINVLINNAGIAHFGPLLQTSTADYQRIIDVNQT